METPNETAQNDNGRLITKKRSLARISTRYVLLFNWDKTCAAAKRQRVPWPVNVTVDGALQDLEASRLPCLALTLASSCSERTCAMITNDATTRKQASLAAAQMAMIAPGGREVSWLRGGSGLDLSLRCDHTATSDNASSVMSM